MPRLFTGLQVPPDIALRLSLMRGGVPGARWIDPENFHITLRFIGDVSAPVADEIVDALDAVSVEPVEIAFAGIDYFGGNKPHSLHVRVALNEPLRRLQAAHERICQMAGLAPETRRFTPHVTLARLRGVHLGDVRDFVSHHNLVQDVRFSADRFVLLSSKPGRGGGPYKIEETYPLQPLAAAV